MKYVNKIKIIKLIFDQFETFGFVQMATNLNKQKKSYIHLSCNNRLFYKSLRSMNVMQKLKCQQYLPVISFSVQLPVFKQYKCIDLKKTSQYQRIDRLKLQHMPQSKFFFKQDLDNISSQKKIKKIKSLTQHEKDLKLINHSNQISWKSEVNKYIDAKFNSCLADNKDDEDFPLMKLTPKNQLRRKIMMSERLESDKPNFIKLLEKQELYTQKIIQKKRNLPHIVKLRRKASKTQDSNNPTLSIKRISFVKEIMKKANKSEKVLIQFIGNYFKEKFLPKRRFSHQRNLNDSSGMNQISLKAIQNPKCLFQ